MIKKSKPDSQRKDSPKAILNDLDITVVRSPGRAELLELLKKYEVRLPADFRFDRDEANSR